ncbi:MULTISPECIES: ribosomal L7Ae/L30e/S12e/Gadd45 family protein [Clostridium]|uniref:50S ribosomal protein L7ae-like protein n=1 Tax=Clostridium senegalense TaxID=1465809 RepID=A0A6M0H784_9CLOT|nr:MULTISPECIES: ribosomal L7Ae/L30e/S12e/Gadd45 family protein [Clostridium]NEU06545.1 50S ribosomal protein L7ae-like protein [Clostridium senegalense]
MVSRLTGEKVVGIKQTTKALKAKQGKILYIAKDVDPKIANPILELAKANYLQIEYVETMKDLGKLCSIDVSAATALIL